MSTNRDIARAEKHAENNWEEVQRSTTCGCFYCGNIFPAGEARQWDPGFNFAVCPLCYTGAVIGDASGLPVTCEFLTHVKTRVFDDEVVRAEAEASRKPRPYRCRYCKKVVFRGHVPEGVVGATMECFNCGRLQSVGGPEIRIKQ